MKAAPVYKKKWSKLLVVIMSAMLFLGGCSEDATATANEVETTSSIDKATQKSIEKEEKRVAKEAKKALEESEEQAEEEQKQAEKDRKIAEEASIEQAEAESKAKEEELALLQGNIHSSLPSVPENAEYVEVNGNVPVFTNEDISSTEAWEDYGSLDHLGRVTPANAVLGVELMPAEERGSISSVTPTGWVQAKYDIVSAGWLYNRSHLIGHQLTGEDANEENLMTGTRYFNTEGMLPFENFVANYIEETENHLRYRITPFFEGDNLLASGVFMEGFSIEDNGEGLSFHIYVPNHQPGVSIDYATGASWVDGVAVEAEPVVEPETTPPAPTPEPVPVPVGGDVSTVDTNGNGQVTIKEAKAAGFSMPIYSDHWLYPHMDDKDGDGMVGE